MSTWYWLALGAAVGFLVGYVACSLNRAITQRRENALPPRAGKKIDILFRVVREGWPSR